MSIKQLLSFSPGSGNTAGTLVGSGFATWWFAIASWVFILEYSLYLVRPNFPDKLIKLVAFACLTIPLLIRHSGFRLDERKLLLLYFGLLLSALLPSIYIVDGAAIAQWLKFAFMFSILPALLIVLRISKDSVRLMVLLYFVFAILFSIQALVAFGAVFAGYFQLPEVVEIGRRPGQVANSLGWLGFANAVQNPIGCVRVLRVQGWFVEPSIFSAFLVFPALVALGYNLQKRTAASIFCALVILAALVMTFSIAGYIAVTVSLMFLFLSGPFHRYFGKIRYLTFVYPLVVTLVLLLVARGGVGLANVAYDFNLSSIAALKLEQSAPDTKRANPVPETNHTGTVGLECLGSSGLMEVGEFSATARQKLLISMTKMFAKSSEGPSGNLFREGYKFSGYKAVILSNPLGVGLGTTSGENELTSANAILFWLVAGGIPALLIAVMLFWFLFWTYCHPLLQSKNYVSRCIAASFIGHAVHNLSYGNWMAPFFLLHVAIVVVVARQLSDNIHASDTTAPSWAA